MNSQLCLRPYAPGDEAAILRSHARAFAAVDPAYAPRTLEEWRWRFAECPAGARIVVETGADGDVRGHYAGIRQPVRSVSGAATFTQAVDSFQAARARGGLAGAGAFVRAGELFARTFCGPGPELDQVVWGLAIPAVWRIGAARLGYEHVRTVVALCARTAELDAEEPGSAGAEGASAPARGALEVAPSARCPEDAEPLFARFAADRGALAVRDRATLDWRFARRPGVRYEFAAARAGGTLRGLAVARRGAFAGREGLLLCDWIVPADDADAQRALLGWCKRRAREQGCAELVALFPDTAPEWLELQRRGFRVVPTEYVLAARCFAAPFDRDFLFWRWHYSLGDTDLV